MWLAGTKVIPHPSSVVGKHEVDSEDSVKGRAGPSWRVQEQNAPDCLVEIGEILASELNVETGTNTVAFPGEQVGVDVPGRAKWVAPTVDEQLSGQREGGIKASDVTVDLLDAVSAVGHELFHRHAKQPF